jgi:hypothetical protein
MLVEGILAVGEVRTLLLVRHGLDTETSTQNRDKTWQHLLVDGHNPGAKWLPVVKKPHMRAVMQ